MSSKFVTLFTLLLFTALSVFSLNQIGEIVYLEDEVEIVRDSETIYSEEIDIGSEINNYDLLTTLEAGYAEVEIATPQSAGTTIKVSPNTSFYFELNSVGKDQKTTIGMLGGSISLKVKKITGNRSVEVKTEYTTMGVRGTSFEITIEPAGSILVTCELGRVACTDDSGRELIAEPGTVVEKQAGEIFRAIPVRVSDLETYRRDWYAERLELFKANALKATRFYAVRYKRLKAEFDEIYRALLQERDILNKWAAEDSKSGLGTKIEMMREKKKIIRHLFALRKNLYMFERVYFRLQELNTYYEQGYGRGSIGSGVSAVAFFQEFNRDKKSLSSKMAKVRYVTKLYALRNNGNFPTDLFEQGESDFFSDDEDNFFKDADSSL